MKTISRTFADVFAKLDGVEVTHHYLGDGTNNVYVHMKVADDDALQRLLKFTETANVAVQIYRHDEDHYRYTAVVTPLSYSNVLQGVEQKQP